MSQRKDSFEKVVMDLATTALRPTRRGSEWQYEFVEREIVMRARALLAKRREKGRVGRWAVITLR